MGVRIHVARLVDGGEGEPRVFEQGCEFVEAAGGDGGAHRGDGPAARLDLVHPGLKPRILQQPGEPEDAADGGPLPLGHRADEDRLALPILENVVDGPGEFALRHRRRVGAFQLILDHVLGDQQQAVLEQAHAQLAPAAGLPPLHQRGEHAEGREEPAHDVVGRGSDPQRPPRRAGHVGEAGHHLHHFVQRGAVLIGPGQEPLAAGEDQPRMPGAQGRRIHPGLDQRAVAEVFDEHIRRGQQGRQRGAPRLGLHVERHGFLAAVEQREHGAAHAGQVAGLVARGRLHLDHFGAQIGQEHAGRGPHDHVAHLHHANAGQRPESLLHRVASSLDGSLCRVRDSGGRAPDIL